MKWTAETIRAARLKHRLRDRETALAQFALFQRVIDGARVGSSNFCPIGRKLEGVIDAARAGGQGVGVESPPVKHCPICTVPWKSGSVIPQWSSVADYQFLPSIHERSKAWRCNHCDYSMTRSQISDPACDFIQKAKRELHLA